MSDQGKMLREAMEIRDRLIQEMTSLVHVAAMDVVEIWGEKDAIDPELFAKTRPRDEVLVSGGSHEATRYSRRFAEMLVDRLLTDDYIELTYDEPEDEDVNTPEFEVGDES